ncbi:Hypothetical predicted protein [Olea europaea subsp. europaea]|uniref:Uncharacterized protein n=1 Tax=Olea europaea subsp. europaea TaxID=158383 RepID=A0A8S0VDZ1_OLEEU|nr:Hypothetical predicted protein [Olea europaea subsp. europaea]
MIDYDGTISSKSDASGKQNNQDDEFSDSEGEESSSRSTMDHTSSAAKNASYPNSGNSVERMSSTTNQTEQLALGNEEPANSHSNAFLFRTWTPMLLRLLLQMLLFSILEIMKIMRVNKQ